jgi:hypothetical protein
LRTILASAIEKEGLLCHVDCQYLSDSGIREYIEAISKDTITLPLWESIYGRIRHLIDICRDLPPFRVPRKQKVVWHQYSEGSFDGLLN